VRLIARAALALLAVVLVWAGERAAWHMEVKKAATFKTPWGSWLWWIALLVLAGVSFGLAAMSPDHFRYRPVRALALGFVPLLMLAYYTIVLGPAALYAAGHLRFLARHDFFFIGPEAFAVAFALAVLLGIAIASGFAPGD
jgi:hypothetical protein